MKKFYLIFVIIILAAALRVWQIGQVPPSPDWDEAALGYNAYSIMKTGRDEYGQFLPIVLRSFDDYKPALYTYLAIPSIAIFGLNTFAVRLPSAIFGILTVLATYFLLKELFRNTKLKLEIGPPAGGLKLEIPEVATFLLAISPWHLQFSRVAFESNVGLAFNVLAVLFFLKGLKKPWFLILSAICASLGLYVYQSEKIFTPLLVLALVLIFRKELFALSKKYLPTAFLVGFIVAMPLLKYTLTNKSALTRARGVSVFADQTPFLQRNAQKILRDKAGSDYLGLILDNRRVQYVLAGVNGYLSHFNLNWLFITGDEARHHAPFMGLLYLWELPFLLYGFYKFIFSSSADRFEKKTKWLLLSWFLLAPVPASITSGVPHAIRTLNFLPTFQVFTAIGVIYALVWTTKYQPPIRKFLVTGFLVVIAFNFIYYLDQYFVQQNYFNSRDWQYGYKEAVEEVKNLAPKVDKIIVSNKPYLDQSYMFFLFYLKYDPLTYQKAGGTVSGGFAEEHRGFGKFNFRPIDWGKEEKSANILYVGRVDDFPENVNALKTINFLNGEPAIKIVSGV